MIDPHEQCPRCDATYIQGSDKTDVYSHLRCSNGCLFLYFDSPLTRREFQLTLNDDAISHTIFWLEDGTTSISNRGWDGGHRTSSKSIIIDHWIPFDLTLEQLKVYLTFS